MEINIIHWSLTTNLLGLIVKMALQSFIVVRTYTQDYMIITPLQQHTINHIIIT